MIRFTVVLAILDIFFIGIKRYYKKKRTRVGSSRSLLIKNTIALCGQNPSYSVIFCIVIGVHSSRLQDKKKNNAIVGLNMKPIS